MLRSLLNDEAIVVVASCVHKIEKLSFDVRGVKMNIWNKLSIAIRNRPTPVR